MHNTGHYLRARARESSFIIFLYTRYATDRKDRGNKKYYLARNVMRLNLLPLLLLFPLFFSLFLLFLFLFPDLLLEHTLIAVSCWRVKKRKTARTSDRRETEKIRVLFYFQWDTLITLSTWIA